MICCSWCDNISAVENKGIYHAKGQWYLSIDGDEWFEDVEDILRFFKQDIYRNYNTAAYIQRNYLDSKGIVFEDYNRIRMAEITPTLHFEGRIYNTIITQEKIKSYMLQSYVHHNKFAGDRIERGKEKLIQDVTVLLYDVYEYPNHLYYRFQLANEYRFIKCKDVTIGLFAQIIALAKETQNHDWGRIGVIRLFYYLYEMEDIRLFSWTQYLKDFFPFSLMEQIWMMWAQEILAYKMKKTADEILTYYDSYKRLLKQYRKDPSGNGVNQYLTFYKWERTENEVDIMNAEAIAFCCYLKAGEEEKALELLYHLSLEKIDNLYDVLEKGFTGGEAVYRVLFKKLTAIQWEEWSKEILDIFVFSFTKDNLYHQQAYRFPNLLAQISVSSIISWLECSKEKRKEKIGESLYQYAMKCNIEKKLCRNFVFVHGF